MQSCNDFAVLSSWCGQWISIFSFTHLHWGSQPSSGLLCWNFLLAYFKYRLRHLLWKTLSLFSSHLLIFHITQPCIKSGFTSVLYSLTLVRWLMLWLLQIFFNLKNTPHALTTLLWMSSVPPPSLETVAPKYTNWSTSFPHPFTSTISLFCEFIRSSLHLSTLIFSPTLPASWASLLVLVWMCCLVDDKRAISSTTSSSSSFVLNFHLIPVFPSCNLFLSLPSQQLAGIVKLTSYNPVPLQFWS